MTNMGWQCPKCDRVYAPFVTGCDACNQQASLPALPTISATCASCGKWPCVGTGTGCSAVPAMWPSPNDPWVRRIVPRWQPAFDHLYRPWAGPICTWVSAIPSDPDAPITLYGTHARHVQ